MIVIFVFHPVWIKCTIYTNLEAPASFACIYQCMSNRNTTYTTYFPGGWALNEGVVFVRLMPDSGGQEYTANIDLDVTSLTFIVEPVRDAFANFALHKIIEF